MLFECMGIKDVFIPAHACEMRGFLVYLLLGWLAIWCNARLSHGLVPAWDLLHVKYLSFLFKSSHSSLDWRALS